MCNVDGVIYQNNERIPTDNPCEVCYCRPPGFACVLKDCELKPHCKAVRREGQCCPDYHCGKLGIFPLIILYGATIRSYVDSVVISVIQMAVNMMDSSFRTDKSFPIRALLATRVTVR